MSMTLKRNHENEMGYIMQHNIMSLIQKLVSIIWIGLPDEKNYTFMLTLTLTGQLSRIRDKLTGRLSRFRDKAKKKNEEEKVTSNRQIQTQVQDQR